MTGQTCRVGGTSILGIRIAAASPSLPSARTPYHHAEFHQFLGILAQMVKNHTFHDPWAVVSAILEGVHPA